MRVSIKQKENRFRLYGAVYLLLEKNGEILLQKRQNTGWHDGEYSLVTGHIDGNLTIKQEVIREAREEAGIEVYPEDLQVVHIAHQIGSEREYICYYLRATSWDGVPENLEPEFSSELTWYSWEALPHNLEIDVLSALQKYREGEFISEFDWRESIS